MNVLWILGIDLDLAWWQLLLLGIFVLVVVYYKYMTWHYGIFKEMGIPGPKPTPIIGNAHMIMKIGFLTSDEKLLKEYGENGNFVGVFMGRNPELIARDASFIKQVTVKEFNNFIDRNNLNISSKPLDRALTSLRGEEWRVIRNTLTPTFSGGKMKRMNQKINGCAEQFVENIAEYSEKDKTFDLLKMAGQYTMDVIARTAFGLETNCQKEDSRFVKYANEAMNTTLRSFLFIMFLFPFAVKFVTRFRIAQTIEQKHQDFFGNIADQSLKARMGKTQKGTQDFMQLMADAHTEATEDEHMEEENREIMKQDKNKKKVLTRDEILGNALLFFLAGYDTTANTLSFIGYCLATNPECQDRLCNEIDQVLGDKTPKYEILPDMPYLEQVINETLRLYPQAPKLTRYCQNDITINGIFVPKGMQIGIPCKALHMNPAVWPEPEKFDPERFSSEEKAKRDPYNYLPFGIGPRSCIAMRLALMEMKIAVISILQKFKFETAEETENPVQMHALRSKPKNGMFLKAVKRSTN